MLTACKWQSWDLNSGLCEAGPRMSSLSTLHCPYLFTSNSRTHFLSYFPSYNLFSFGPISTTIYILALTLHLSFSVFSCSLSFHVIYNLHLLLEAKTWSYLLCFCLSLRAVRAWWLSVCSGGRLFADIWLSSGLAVSPLASSFTFLHLHFCICTMWQVIIMMSESGCEV